jgi:hypothetical protein
MPLHAPMHPCVFYGKEYSENNNVHFISGGCMRNFEDAYYTLQHMLGMLFPREDVIALESEAYDPDNSFPDYRIGDVVVMMNGVWKVEYKGVRVWPQGDECHLDCNLLKVRVEEMRVAEGVQDQGAVKARFA